MAWIESHTVLIRHRKLVALARALRLKPVYVLGHLHALWHVALEQQEDGDLSKWDDEMIATYSCYSGDAPQYVRRLQEHGWMDGRLLHDWLDYAGDYLIARYHSSNRNRLCSIWKLHGYKYGGKEVIRKRIGSEQETNSHLTIPNQPDLPNQPTTSAFDRFWSAYPRKTKKQDAAVSWRRLAPDAALIERILSALEIHKRSDQWVRDGGRFIPHPSTWLNSKRWEDEVTVPRARSVADDLSDSQRKRLKELTGGIGQPVASVGGNPYA